VYNNDSNSNNNDNNNDNNNNNNNNNNDTHVYAIVYVCLCFYQLTFKVIWVINIKMTTANIITYTKCYTSYTINISN
jgi:hypothetical protein